MNKFSRKNNPQTADFEAIQTNASLFRSLSHDLRNPISSIISASSFYLSGIGTLDDNQKRSLVQHINDDSFHLLTMLENILTVSQLYDTSVPLCTSPEAVEEVLSSAIAKLKLKFPTAIIHAKVPVKMLLVSMDGILIQQALFTIMKTLLTACETKFPLECTLFEKDSSAMFFIDSPNTLKESSAPSCDIDIAVCKLIIHAHKGSFSYSMKKKCSSFAFTIPLGGFL